MSDWLHDLPVVWMALVIFGFTYLVAAAIYSVVAVLAVGERARSFKAISPGMLPPLGIVFGLFVAFTAAQVWNDSDRANAAVNREASALRSVVLLGAAFLRFTPRPLAEVLELTLALTPGSQGQQIAQREIATAVENALDARRQRIIISRSHVNWVKWSCLFVQAVCALFAVALVHSGDRLASTITMGMFASGVAACLLLIASHDRPFTGQISVGPDPLLQIMPEAGARQQGID
jgi:hypothetical protein